MYNSLPPAGTLDPQQPWYKAKISAAHWDRFKAKLIGGKDASGTSYFSMVNVSGAEADKIIANMKKDPRGYPQMNQGDPEALYNYQTWVVSEYLGSKPKGSKLIDDKDVGKSSEGKTTVYKADDKFIDDKMEELDQKLDKTSDKIMDVVDEFIAQQKQAFEDFKRQEEEKVKQRIAGWDQYSEPIGPKEKSKEFGYNQYPRAIGPLPMQGPKQAPVQGPKQANVSDEEWESETNDLLSGKLDNLLQQVRNDPLPAASTKRRKTKGKTPVRKRKLADAKGLGLGGTLSEIIENVVETKKALFDLYKTESKRFELRKKTDANLSQILKSKSREASLEGNLKNSDGDGGDGGNGNDDPSDSLAAKTMSAGLIAAVTAFVLPMALNALRPFFKEEEKQVEEDLSEPPASEVETVAEGAKAEAESELSAPPEEPQPEPEAQPAAPQPETTPTPAPPTAVPAPVRDTSIPGDYDYRGPSMPLRAAAKGGKFEDGKHEPLKPLSSKETAKEAPIIKKLTKPLTDSITLPQKVVALGTLSMAKTILGPFASILPQDARSGIESVFDNISRSAGLTGFDFSLSSEKGIFDQVIEKVKKLFEPLLNLFKRATGDTSPGAPDVPGDAASSSSSRASSSGATKTGAAFSTSAGQDKFVTEIFNAAQQSGAKHPIVAAAIASLETGFGKNEYDNAPFNQRNPDGSFKKYNSRAEAVADFVKLWDKSHGGYKNLDQYDDPLEAFKAIVHAYAPASDGNNPDSYIQFVSNFIATYKDKLGKTPPKPPVKPTPPEPRPRAQSRSAQISQRLAERNKKPKATKPTVPVGTSTDKQSGV